MLTLSLLASELKEQVADYKDEFLRNNDSLDGTAGLKEAASFDEWYQTCLDNEKPETTHPGFVPATLYLAFNEQGRLVGMIHFRHYLNEYLLNFGGHIGYSVRKSERRKGYATEMLALVLEETRKRELDKVLLTCNKANIASARTIRKNGGVLENEVPQGNRTTQRYWITL